MIQGRSQTYQESSVEVTDLRPFETLLDSAYAAFREDPLYVVDIAEASRDVVPRQPKERLAFE